MYSPNLVKYFEILGLMRCEKVLRYNSGQKINPVVF